MLVVTERLGAVVIGGGAILLLWAGAPQLVAATWSRRAIGLAEVVLAALVLLGPGQLVAVLLGAIFLVFTLVHLHGVWTGAASCECFGEPEHVNPRRAAALSGLVTLLAAGAAAVDTPSVRQLASHNGAVLAWLPTAALAAALAWRFAFSRSVPLGRIADLSGALLERGVAPGRSSAAGEPIERRSFLLRVAVFGSALAVAPLRYVLYPGTALGAVVAPWDCGSGDCTDGYTGFCCEIQKGGVNTCPTGTFAGGWWMCTDYLGRQLCSEQGVRYYVDCNALPGLGFPGGCRCGNDSCANRRINCNIFRYGQCNTHIDGVTAVVCRMVVCENPSKISELHCSAALAVDNAVCGDEAGCLEPPALELVGAGGV